jgi:glycosyltransferase involved in cell wall biosynthesis
MQFFQPLSVERPSGGDTNVQEKIPKVTIGMPVYNGERLIRKALDSILAQTLDDFVLIISDNASNDGTGEICLEYARRDPRIRYIRQPVNRGASFNFWFVFDQAATEYFMWAASDDVRSPDFRKVNVRFLESNPDYVGSTCPVKSAGGDFDEVKMGDQSLTGTRFDSTVLFFETWHANGRFYSLFRKDAILGWKVLGGNFLGSDWALIIHLIGIGKLNRSEVGWVILCWPALL